MMQDLAEGPAWPPARCRSRAQESLRSASQERKRRRREGLGSVGAVQERVAESRERTNKLRASSTAPVQPCVSRPRGGLLQSVPPRGCVYSLPRAVYTLRPLSEHTSRVGARPGAARAERSSAGSSFELPQDSCDDANRQGGKNNCSKLVEHIPTHSTRFERPDASGSCVAGEAVWGICSRGSPPRNGSFGAEFVRAASGLLCSIPAYARMPISVFPIVKTAVCAQNEIYCLCDLLPTSPLSNHPLLLVQSPSISPRPSVHRPTTCSPARTRDRNAPAHPRSTAKGRTG